MALRETVIASLFLGAIAVAVSTWVGHFGVGVGLAAGLAIGSANGFLMRATIDTRAPFVPASFFRLALLTGTAVMVALVLHAVIWTVALGVGGAQLVWATMSVRQALRA